MSRVPEIVLENGLDLNQVVTTGSILHINQDFNDEETETESVKTEKVDFIGQPVKCFAELEKQMIPVDTQEYVKKKIVEPGGGVELHDGCTVSIAYSGYWEDVIEPFDVRSLHKPLEVDLKDNGLLPGLQVAVRSMLVGEVSIFLLSYQLMYGELGIPPRIKPKADCVFFIKLIRSILTPEKGAINLSEPNMFERVQQEAKMLYKSGLVLFKSKNSTAAIQLFRRAVNMLDRCRLADENEEKLQEKLLIKLYINLAICYNKARLPLKACTACNELNRLTNIWNNGKILYNNAKALRMIGAFDNAEKRLLRAMKLYPNSEEMKAEYEILRKTRDACNYSNLIAEKVNKIVQVEVSEEFKQEVDRLVKNFKENDDICKLTLPARLHDAEVEYIKKVCQKENIFCNKIKKNFALDKDGENIQSEINEAFENML